MLRKNTTPGKLIIVEGIDGSGKSTQIDLLYKWLHTQGRSVYFSEWNSSELVKSTTKRAKKRKLFTPTTFSLLQCTDFADRWENRIFPMLKAGVIVLADRYAFTAFGRDVARGVDREWVRNLYSFAIQPDIALYFRVPLDVSVQIESFKLFQERILNEYDNMVNEFNLIVIDGNLTVQAQQRLVRGIVKQELDGWKGLPIPEVRPHSPFPVKIDTKKGKA